ncbi:MAG: FHA domain-containing protein [Candidatus Solibacter sp.]
MSLYQSLYYMSLVGGLAGLAAWALTTLLAALFRFPAFAPDLIPAVLLGSFMGGLTVGFTDHWSGNRVMPRWVLAGAGVGCLAGLLGSVLVIPIRESLLTHYPVLVRVLTWILVASFVGFALGLRRARVNRARIGHPVTGGLLAGLVSGLLFTMAGSSYPDITNAVCFTLTGVGVSCGLTLAPILMREAVVQFVRSGDVRAQSKFGRSHKQWPIQQGDSYIIGSQSSTASQTRLGPEVEIYIPDSAIASRHATMFAKEGRYFIARHQDSRAAAAMARYPLKVRGRNVSSAQQLQHLDDILIGRTSLRFQILNKESE